MCNSFCWPPCGGSLITRTRHSERLTVTAAGRRLAQRAVAVVEVADAEFFSTVGKPEQLLDVLRHLAD